MIPDTDTDLNLSTPPPVPVSVEESVQSQVCQESLFVLCRLVSEQNDLYSDFRCTDFIECS